MRFQSCNTFTPLWRHFNRADRGCLEPQIIAPDCYFWDLSLNTYHRFSDYLPCSDTPRQLTVLLAGSFS